MVPLRGYSLWGEEFRGRGTNWFLVLPNIYGLRPDPDGHEWIRFEGLAIRITDGVFISWDGRDIRHCTSLSEPDGPPVEVVGGRGLAHWNVRTRITFTGPLLRRKKGLLMGGESGLLLCVLLVHNRHMLSATRWNLLHRGRAGGTGG